MNPHSRKSSSCTEGLYQISVKAEKVSLSLNETAISFRLQRKKCTDLKIDFNSMKLENQFHSVIIVSLFVDFGLSIDNTA